MPFAPTRPHLLHLSIRLQPTSRTLAPKRPHPSKPPHLPAPPGRVDKARVRIASLSLSLSTSNSHSRWLVIDPLAVVNSCNLPHVSQLIAIFWYFNRFLQTKKKLPLRQWEFCFHEFGVCTRRYISKLNFCNKCQKNRFLHQFLPKTPFPCHRALGKRYSRIKKKSCASLLF